MSDMEKRMSKGWRNGLPETPCGRGSTIGYTEIIREHLPKIIDMFGIKTINDIGAGDLNWIKETDIRGAKYRPFDVVPRNPMVRKLDITEALPPPCDLAICRDVLIHLTNDEALRAIDNIQKSSKYAMFTSHHAIIGKNQDLGPGDVWRPVCLHLPPFNLREKAVCVYIIEEDDDRWSNVWRWRTDPEED